MQRAAWHAARSLRYSICASNATEHGPSEARRIVLPAGPHHVEHFRDDRVPEADIHGNCAAHGEGKLQKGARRVLGVEGKLLREVWQASGESRHGSGRQAGTRRLAYCVEKFAKAGRQAGRKTAAGTTRLGALAKPSYNSELPKRSLLA